MGTPARSAILAMCILNCAAASMAFAREPGDTRIGFLAIFGGRYDNMRMCVGSPAGTKGGPIGDIMLTGRYAMSDRSRIGLNLPVMRPVLFAAAFKMLQFEPEAQIEFRIPSSGSAVDLIVAPSLGASFHYGPDYRSDLKNRSGSFFAAGPIAGVHAGVGRMDDRGVMQSFIGVKPFYVLLFSRGHGRGTVVGAAVEYSRAF